MSEPLGIALVGCGTVGTAVAELITRQADRWQARAGRALQLRHVVVRDRAKPRAAAINADIVTEDFERVLTDADVQVVVELAGGTSAARDMVLAALDAGKHVVTANKALLAEHGDEVFAAARRHNRVLGFEASVAGGVPVIAALTRGLSANRITALRGILNGTSNFILTAMGEGGVDYSAALADAQARGYAEADPTLDVNGMDAVHKLAILARVAFGRSVQPGQIPRCGIAGISELDVRLAAELGCVVKLIATATFNNDDALALSVGPTLVRKNTPLADVRGSCNALLVAGDLAGETCYSGPGAGANPTASAVFADLIDLALGRSQVGFTAARWWEAPAGTVLLEVTPPCRWYLRLSVDDRPGVLAAMAAALARQHVSIASVVQHAAVVGQSVPVVILTHPASRRPVQDAISEIAALAFLRESVVAMPVN